MIFVPQKRFEENNARLENEKSKLISRLEAQEEAVSKLITENSELKARLLTDRKQGRSTMEPYLLMRIGTKLIKKNFFQSVSQFQRQIYS